MHASPCCLIAHLTFFHCSNAVAAELLGVHANGAAPLRLTGSPSQHLFGSGQPQHVVSAFCTFPCTLTFSCKDEQTLQPVLHAVFRVCCMQHSQCSLCLIKTLACYCCKRTHREAVFEGRGHHAAGDLSAEEAELRSLESRPKPRITKSGKPSTGISQVSGVWLCLCVFCVCVSCVCVCVCGMCACRA